MIKDDDRIEFIFEKIISEPNEEDSGTSVELFVKYDSDGLFGPTLGFTEELEPSKRSKSEWTYLPVSFIKEVAEYLHAKGAIETLSVNKKNSNNLPGPVVSGSKSSGSSSGLNIPKISQGFPNNQNQSPMVNHGGNVERGTPSPTNLNQPISNGPQLKMSENSIEIQNSHPPYQKPMSNMHMHSQSQSFDHTKTAQVGPQYSQGSPEQYYNAEAAQNINPFGANAGQANYQVPLQSFSHAMQPHQGQPQQGQPQQGQPQQGQPQQGQPQQGQPQPNYSQKESDPNDLTSMLNSDVQETPSHLKGAAADMLQQRAQALSKQVNGSNDKKIKPQGKVRQENVSTED